jgi:hypothetical protein
MSAPHSYDLIATMALHAKDCVSPFGDGDWIMDHRRLLLARIIYSHVGQRDRRYGRMKIGTLVCRMVSEWHYCIHTEQMDVSIVDFVNHVAFHISV